MSKYIETDEYKFTVTLQSNKRCLLEDQKITKKTLENLLNRSLRVQIP